MVPLGREIIQRKELSRQHGSTQAAWLPTRARVRSRWCHSTDQCDGKHGPVYLGALQKPENLERAQLALPNTSWRPTSQRCWRLLLPAVLEATRQQSASAVYQFGVYLGASMYLYRKWWPDSKLLAFDSFAGLPDEQRGEVRRATWVAGTFGVDGTAVMQRIIKDLGAHTRLFPGFFNVTLTPELATTLPPATLVDIDSDIYRSAYEALDWMFANRLARVGTIIAYDDWLDYACAPTLGGAELRALPRREVEDSMRTGFMPPSRQTRWRDSKMSVAVRARAKQRIYPRLLAAGEPKAHSEIAKRHSVRFRCLAGSCRPARLPKPACDPHHAYRIRRHLCRRGRGRRVRSRHRDGRRRRPGRLSEERRRLQMG